MKWLLTFLALMFISSNAIAQARVTTVGLQIKPIFPIDFLETGEKKFNSPLAEYSLKLNGGFSGGMVIRKGLSNLIAIETGINYVKRNYLYSIAHPNFQQKVNYRLIGYEIPVHAMIFIQTGEHIFMNASLGMAVDMFASNVVAATDSSITFARRRATFQPALNANVGAEYRTIGSGYWYLGATFHQPFNYSFANFVEYPRGAGVTDASINVNGAFLTIDLRYYFNEAPQKRKKKK
ncbi:MAG: hypothetical protein RIQ89_345 [Bacteroidota bacterium]|jgi:hypothetical protein